MDKGKIRRIQWYYGYNLFEFKSFVSFYLFDLHNSGRNSWWESNLLVDRLEKRKQVTGKGRYWKLIMQVIFTRNTFDNWSAHLYGPEMISLLLLNNWISWQRQEPSKPFYPLRAEDAEESGVQCISVHFVINKVYPISTGKCRTLKEHNRR